MSDFTQHRVRLHVLAVATTLALSSVAALGASAAERVNLSGLQASQTYDRFIVKYRDGSRQRAGERALQASLNRAVVALPAVKGQATRLKHVRHLAVQADVVKSSRKLDRADAESLMRQIAADPNVVYVEIDKLNHAFLTPDDTRFAEQFGFGTGPGGIHATEAWDITSGAGAVVAVLDTGITNHSDLNANILPGYDFIIDTAISVDGDGRDADASDPGDAEGSSASSWHGTHVAGTIAAVTNNAKGVAGTAFSAKIVPVRVLGKGGGYDSDIADAIIWASGGTVAGVPANANPAEAINLSLGGSGACGATMQSAIDVAVARGTTLAIAAGNSNANTTGSTPANCNNVVAVGSTTSTGARSSFSNYGAIVDIAGPGSAILSTLNAGTTVPAAETYATYSGTSMATPHVAGVIALMQSVAAVPMTPAQVEVLLKSSARAFPVAPSQPIGAGIVNAKAAVDAAIAGIFPPTADFTFTSTLLVVNFTDTSSDSDGTIVSRNWNFGDGTTSTATNPSKTYTAPGSYTVVLTSTDDDGATSTKTQTIVVNSGADVVQTYVNDTDVAIPDVRSADSAIVVAGRAGATRSAIVTVNIVHTWRGDLTIDLVASNGRIYRLQNRRGGSADNINATYKVTLLPGSPHSGTWTLRVRDNDDGDVGTIDRWSITF